METFILGKVLAQILLALSTISCIYRFARYGDSDHMAGAVFLIAVIIGIEFLMKYF